MRTPCFLFLTLLLAAFVGPQGASATSNFPIATNSSLVELNGGVASSGGNYLESLLSGTNVCIQLVSSNGTLMGSLTPLGQSKGEPRCAFGGTNYLVAWFDDFTSSAVAEIIASSGTPTGSAFSLPNAPEAIATDGTNFLAVLRDNANNVYGQLITPTGALLGPEFLVGNQSAKYPAVAFGKTNYLVVMNACYGVLVTPGGSAGNIFQINSTTSAANNYSAVAFDGTNYLVAWMWNPGPDTGGSLTNWEIFGRLVSPAGGFAGNELQLVTDPGNNVIPSLAFDGSDYLLTWGYGFQAVTNPTIRCQFLNRAGGVIGLEFVPISNQGANTPLLSLAGGLIFDGIRYELAATLGTSSFQEVYGALIPASTASPTLAAAGPLAGNQFPLQLTGTPGINYAIQFSTNLTLENWRAITTNSPTNGALSFIDAGATSKSRFYRAMKQ